MILIYHNVGQQVGFNTVSAENFERQLRYVQQRWLLADMDTYVRECHSNPKLATVTFDDAYSCTVSHVLPILEKLHVPITIFVPVSLVGKYNIWDKNWPEYQKINILSWTEIEQLSQHPLVTFGSHGMDHISFSSLSQKQIDKELKESKEILEERLQKSVDYFAYPYGQRKDFGHATPKLLQKFGYKAAFTTLWKRNNLKDSLYRLRRVEIRPSDAMNDFQRFLTRKIDFRYLKQEIKSLIR